MNKLYKKAVWLAVPGIAGFVLFYLLPYLFVVRYSVKTGDGVSFEHFHAVLTNEYFRLALRNTALFILVSIPLMLVLSYILTEISVRHRYGSVFTIILFLPTLMPSVSTAAVWAELFPGERAWPIMLLFVWKNVGLMTLILTAGRLRIPREVFDAAAIDGANVFTLHRCVILPLMTPVLFFSSLVGLIQSFKIFREIYLLYDAYPPEDLYMIPHYIFNKFNKLDYGELSAGTLIFTLLVAAIVAAAGVCVLVYTKGGRKIGKKS